MKNLLFISYYFPPLGMGGVQRAMKFARYLPQFGWNPHVITVKDIHYYARDEGLAREVEGLPILRAGSLDPARVAHILNPAGKKSENAGESVSTLKPGMSNFLHKMLYPDSKVLWMPFAGHGIRDLIKKKKFHAIYSTSPPISAHRLAARFDLPWIADFRDYWTIGDGIYAPSSRFKRKYKEIMTKITCNAGKIITVSEPIAESIRNATSPENRSKVTVIPNGFDPFDFQVVEPFKFEYFTICYLGNLNFRRSPAGLFSVLARLSNKNPQLKNDIRLCFVGKHFDIDLQPLESALDEIVQFKGYQSHASTVAHAKGAGALLLLLSNDSSAGVMTGKVFEYLGARKPILGIIPQHVAAYELLQNMPNCYLAHPDRPDEIEKAVLDLLDRHSGSAGPEIDYKETPEYLSPYTRECETRQLALLLDEITDAGGEAND